MSTETPIQTGEILLLEQNSRETALIRKSVENGHLSVVTKSPEILAFLRRQGKYAKAARPDLVLLDLKLSDSEHCEVLKELKRDPLLKRIPVVVLASSVSYEEIFEAYELHANAYICKPATRKDYVRVLRETLHFWLHLVRLPRD
jgi:CheY-like chemotaxis protein